MREADVPGFAGPLAAWVSRHRAGGWRELPLASPDLALPIPPARVRAVWDPRTGSVDAATVADIVERATADLDRPWPVPLASAAARVHSDGDRDGWESTAFARQHRLSRAVVAAAVTQRDRWLDEIADGVVLLCEQSSWCWPAHDDAWERHGAVLAVVTDPFLDLGAGEVVAQLAWIDQLLGAELDARYPGLRGRIRHEARARVFEPFLRRRDWHWLGLDGDVHNWSPWIHGNVLVAALRLLDAPGQESERAAVVRLVIEGLDRYVASLPADGAIDEGYSYWWNGACRALEALEILRHATGGVLDPVADVPALRATLTFPYRMQLGGAWYVNVADGQARPPTDQPWRAVHAAACHLGDRAAEAHAAAHRTPSRPVASEAAGLGRLLGAMTDPDWLAAVAGAAPLPRESWLPSVELLVAREREGTSAGLTVTAKGGHNGEHHNHNDVGSFLVASDGVPVIVDAGRPTYTAQTFGPDRYAIWTMRSAWHNVPEVGGAEQPAGADFRARDAAVTLTDDVAALSLDLAAAYPTGTVRRWRRTVRLERRGGGRVSVHDSWDGVTDPAGRTLVRLIVAGEVTAAPDGVRVRPLEGATPVRIGWPAALPATIEARPLDDPMLTQVWGARLTRIELDVAHRHQVTVTVEQDPDTDGEHR